MNPRTRPRTALAPPPDPGLSPPAMRRDAHPRRPPFAARSVAARAVRPLLAVAAVAVAVGGTGCQSVHRRLTIQTEPPGALVLVDGRRIGFSPASVSYDYYGTREITLVKDGFQTETFLQPNKPPLYQIPPADFVTDNFLPGQVEDRRVIRKRLRPVVQVPTEGVLERADDLRGRSQVGG